MNAVEPIRTQLRAQIARGALNLPMLPEVAARVISAAGGHETDAAGLAKIIVADPSLAAQVMRVATSAVYQPRSPIENLQTAISWLGMAEVCDIAFTAAVQGKLLNIPGHMARAKRMWRSALGCGQWCRVLARRLGGPAESRYLNGLLHEIGKPATLQAIVELSRRASLTLDGPEVDGLIQEFQVEIGVHLANAWRLPEGLVDVIRSWRDWSSAGARAGACAVVYLAHELTEMMDGGEGAKTLEMLAADPVAGELGLDVAALESLYAEADKIRESVASY